MMTPPSLPHLLSENYGFLHSDECKQQVIEYVKDNKSIAHEEIIFIKSLTKVAEHILESDPGSLDGLLQRIYDFHIEGIMKIQSESGNGGSNYAKEHMTLMRSHLHTHAANFAKAILKNMRNGENNPMQKLFWAQEMYNNHLFSADLISDIDPKHASVQYSNAGKAAWIVFKILEDQKDAPLEKKIEWMKKKHKNEKAAGEKMSEIGNSSFMHEYDNAAKALYTLYNLTGNAYYLNGCYEMRRLLAITTSKTNLNFSASQDVLAAETAIELSKLTGREFWEKRARMHSNKVKSYSSSHQHIKGGSKFRKATEISIDLDGSKNKRGYVRATGYAY